MWNAEVDEEDHAAREMVWEDEGSKLAFCDARSKDGAIRGQDFAVCGSVSCGGEVGEERFVSHVELIAMESATDEKSLVKLQ